MKLKAIALATTAAIATTGTANAQEILEMTSAFGKNLPILGTAGVDFVEKINGISEGVEFEHFDPGELVPTLEALDADEDDGADGRGPASAMVAASVVAVAAATASASAFSRVCDGGTTCASSGTVRLPMAALARSASMRSIMFTNLVCACVCVCVRERERERDR